MYAFRVISQFIKEVRNNFNYYTLKHKYSLYKVILKGLKSSRMKTEPVHATLAGVLQELIAPHERTGSVSTSLAKTNSFIYLFICLPETKKCSPSFFFLKTATPQSDRTVEQYCLVLFWIPGFSLQCTLSRSHITRFSASFSLQLIPYLLLFTISFST